MEDSELDKFLDGFTPGETPAEVRAKLRMILDPMAKRSRSTQQHQLWALCRVIEKLRKAGISSASAAELEQLLHLLGHSALFPSTNEDGSLHGAVNALLGDAGLKLRFLRIND